MKFIATVHILECEIKRIDEEIARIKHRVWRLNTAITALKKEGIEDYRMQKDMDSRLIVIDEWKDWKKQLEKELIPIKELL